jgi:hypothetical protein
VADLPPLPAGFQLDTAPASSDKLPPLPAGFQLDTFAGDSLLSDQSMQKLSAGQQSTVTSTPEPSALTSVRDYGAKLNEAFGRFNRAPDTAGLGSLEALTTMLTGGAVAPVLGTAESAILGTDPATAHARYTYQPRTESGKAQLGILGAAASPLTDSGTDIALAPLAAELNGVKVPKNAPAANTARRVVSGPAEEMAGARAPVAGAQEAAQVVKTSGLEGVSGPSPEVIELGRSSGYKFKPSEVGAKGGAITEGLTGSAKLETDLIVNNQKVTNGLAAEEIGLSKDSRLTPAEFAEAKAPHNRVYDMVGKKLGDVPTDKQFIQDVQSVGRTPGTSFKNAVNPEIEDLKSAYAEEQFNAADAVLETRKLRMSARKNLRSPDPAKNELGSAQLGISDAIESQMERFGEANGQQGLIKKFRESRQSLAKINSVERSIKNGNVDAQVLAKQLDKGVPLSGNLKTIASVASEFPNVTRNAAKIKQQSPVNMTDTAVATAAAVASGNPLALAAMAARPLVRRALTSDRYQNSLAKAKQANAIAEEPAKRNALLEY